MNKISKYYKKNSFISLDYFSEVIGYDQNIFNLPKGTILNGYFQTYKYFDNVKYIISSINLKNPSNWFLQRTNEITEYETLVIHVRRGDYENYANKYGLLSSEYYKRAIAKIDGIKPNLKVWVFSDDIAKAKSLLGNFVPDDTVWVDPKEVEDDAEALLLMSKSHAIITANSTFSWWAAMLSTQESIVVAPSKWYKNMKDPNELIPPNWITIESLWE
jgi:hypothetical protein